MATKQDQAERQDPYARIFGKRYSSTGKAAGPQVSLQDTVSPDVVLVWDLDETLITFHSLISGSFAAGAPLQVQQATRELGRRWEHAALDLLDTHFFYDELDNHNLEHIEDAGQARTFSKIYAVSQTGPLPASWNMAGAGHLPARSRGPGVTGPADSQPAAGQSQAAETWAKVRGRYGQGLTSLAAPGQVEHWAQLYSDTDELTGGWLRHGAQLLHDCTSAAEAAAAAAAQAASAAAGHKRPPAPQAPAHVANILVSAGQLVATLAKLMLFHLDSYFPIQNVYSSAVRGKQQCFARIHERFHQAASFCVIGDSLEEQLAAESQQWPFTQIDSAESCWQALSIGHTGQDPANAFRHPLSDVTARILVSRPQP